MIAPQRLGVVVVVITLLGLKGVDSCDKGACQVLEH